MNLNPGGRAELAPRTEEKLEWGQAENGDRHQFLVTACALPGGTEAENVPVPNFQAPPGELRGTQGGSSAQKNGGTGTCLPTGTSTRRHEEKLR